MRTRNSWGWLLLLAVLAAVPARGAEVIPPKPPRYFNDYAHVVSAATAERLNQQLVDLEQQSSNQIVVAVYPKMQSDSSIDDYTERVFRAWHVGQQGKNNGAILFVFVQNHTMRIQTGYGLEGSLPDATCEDIIEDQIAPHFKANDYDGGLTAGVAAMIQATKGEYKGTGQTVYQRQHRGRRNSGNGGGGGAVLFVIVILFFFVFSIIRRSRSALYGGGGGSFWGGVAGGLIGSALGDGFRGGGGGGFGGGGGGGDGGGFSGGGGDSGGGGASGGW